MSQFFWLGTDEAGYGARLGPLSITGSVWELGAELTPGWNPEAPGFLASADRLNWDQAWGNGEGFKVADSKKLYQPGKGLAGLQRVVTSLLSASNQQAEPASRFGELWEMVQGTALHDSVPYWMAPASDVPFALPNPEQLTADVQRWIAGRIRPCVVRTRLIDEARFNDGLVQWGNKANLLSTQTLELVYELVTGLPETANVIVDLDRHGGRKKYLPLLLEACSADWMDIIEETPRVSVYRWLNAERIVFFRFSVNGEQRFPVAVASMFSKLLRERAMACFNRYWQNEMPKLKATAGYPVDAERFKAEVEVARRRRGISDHRFWRNA